MVKWWVPSFFLLLLFPTRNSSQSVVTLNRCCGSGHSLNRPGDRCIADRSQFTNYETFGQLPTWKDQGKIRADVGLVVMPKCKRIESHVIGSQANLTKVGGLVTNLYEKEFPPADFCLEKNVDQKLMAVVCDPCEEKICLKLCCPHGMIFTPNYNDEDYNPDLTVKDQCSWDDQEWSPKFWNEEDQVEVKLKKDSQYVLQYAGVSTKTPTPEEGEFHCPKPQSLFEEETEFQKFQLSHKYVNDSAIAIGTYIDSNETRTLNNSEFCVTFAHVIDYDNYDDDVAYKEGYEIPIKKRVTFYVCTPEYVDPNSQCVSPYFYPISLIISIIFLLLTIIAHMLLPQLHNYLIGKMTIGFLINMLICYICLTYLYFIDDIDGIRDTSSCTFLGYLIQYSFLAFFFWLNSMAAYIFLNTTKIIHFNIYHDTKQLIIFFIYSQMFPFFISIATAIMDMTEKEYYETNATRWKPNMGQYSCFLGYEKQEPDLNFFQTPQFIYFHSVIIIILILNIIYFVVTLILIIMTRHSSGGSMTNKNNLRLVLTLFFLMGIPWATEIIGGIAKDDLSCPVKILLDVINLFAGPLIFLVLIVKKDILMSLKNILKEKKESFSLTRDNISMTTLT